MVFLRIRLTIAIISMNNHFSISLLFVADQITKTVAEAVPATILSMEFFDRLTKAGKIKRDVLCNVIIITIMCCNILEGKFTETFISHHCVRLCQVLLSK